MQKLSTWLEANPGMATRLWKSLGINATNISNWRHGYKPIPWRHMPAIARLSKGKVTVKEMMDHRNSQPPGGSRIS